ncbi:MAG: hypothetical protein IJ188_08765, partial [Clostridia bacterium]|nr:hypothetical protein [Clostridia bacterium]
VFLLHRRPVLLPAIAAIIGIMLQRIREREYLSALFAGTLDLPGSSGALLLFPFLCEFLLALFAVIRDVIPIGII